MKDSITPLFAVAACCIGLLWAGSHYGSRSMERTITTSCEVTATHLINKDTVIVCQVVRRDDGSVKEREKPKASREQSL
jgi:hypothetical protein